MEEHKHQEENAMSLSHWEILKDFRKLDRSDRQTVAIMIKSLLERAGYRKPADVIRADFSARDPKAAGDAKVSGDSGDSGGHKKAGL